MSELHWFDNTTSRSVVQLPHSIEAIVADWQTIRLRMIRQVHPDFTRSEWAYLIQFIDSDHLRSVFTSTFGSPSAQTDHPDRLLAPRKRIAIWLPNNVSLLGPLTLILLSLIGSDTHVKTGSRSRDLSAALFKWLGKESPAGKLRHWLLENLQIESFNRFDKRNADAALWADARIFFGGDSAAQDIEKLDHPTDSIGFYFSHKVSECWIDTESANEVTAMNLAKVFGIYGQAGCTSPKRVFLMDGTQHQAQAFAQLLRDAWTMAVPEKQPRNVASETFMASQWASANGLHTIPLGQNSALAILCPPGPLPIQAHMAIAIQYGTPDQAIKTAPNNLQTIGHALADTGGTDWITRLSSTHAVRFVPIAAMHDFGPIWDGESWWRNLFTTKILSS